MHWVSKYWLDVYTFTSFMDNSDDRIYPVRLGTFKLNQENRNGTIGQWVETYDRFEDRAIFVDGVVPRVDCARAYPGGRSGIFIQPPAPIPSLRHQRLDWCRFS